MRSFTAALIGLAATASAYIADEEPTATTHLPQCTASSSTGSGAYFDLRPDIAWPEDPDGKVHKSNLHKSYHARGWDYGRNFTVNICNSVVEPVVDVVGVPEHQWANVSAYYSANGRNYSIGSESMDLHSRGRKLLIQYTGGSPCGKDDTSRQARDLIDRSLIDDSTFPYKPHESEEPTGAVGTTQDDDDIKDDNVRRKSTIISFLCDRDPGNTQASVQFVGTDPEECSYFFEARSFHACASAEPHKPGEVGPGSVFSLILIIAIMVYFLGGVFFNRTVNHARGWRQLPNYSLWAGIWNYICDKFMRATNSCAHWFPSQRGYRSLRTGHHNSRDSEQEAQRNRLIDQLDEEWDD